MMGGIIGIVVSIVGADMVNANNRRDFKADEYDLYDYKDVNYAKKHINRLLTRPIIKTGDEEVEDIATDTPSPTPTPPLPPPTPTPEPEEPEA